MEERVPPTTLHNHDHRPLNGHKFDQHHHDSDHDMQIVPSPGHRRQETYIIQIPKDQIYRVPPPENAEIVERYRNPVTRRSRRKRCGIWFLSAVFIAAFVISVIVCVHRFTLSPKPPTFSVQRVLFNRPPASKKSGFRVSVQTTNPNGVNTLEFGQGSASLLYKGKEIGKGHFPPLDKEEPGKSDGVGVIITGSNSKGGGLNLPKELQPEKKKSNSRNHNKSVNLEMSMRIPVKMKTWLWTNDADVKVLCQVEVDSLGDNSKVLLQKCDVQL